MKNSEWIAIKAVRKDGSKIISHLTDGVPKIKLFFKDSTVLIANNIQYDSEQKYVVEKNVISIGNFIKYSIDTLNNIIMTVTETPVQELADDKINKYVFISSRFLFDYFIQSNQITITDDSLVKCNNLFTPSFIGNLNMILNQKFDYNTITRSLSGKLILSSEGNILNLQIDLNKKFNAKDIENLKSVLNSTSGQWVVPKTSRHLGFEMEFTIKLVSSRGFIAANFDFTGPHTNSAPGLTLHEMKSAGNYFKDGIKQFEKGKFESACNSFKKCIKIDSLNTDAYYNLAESYLKLENKSMACETWKILKDMDQTQGINLYFENCKE